MTATVDKLVTVGGNPTRVIDDGSSASSSTSIPTVNKVKSLVSTAKSSAISSAQTYAEKRINGILTLDGSSIASGLSTSYAASTMTVTLTASQANNQAFVIQNATSHSSISASDDVTWIFPASTTGVKSFYMSGSVTGTVQVGTASSAALSIAKTAGVTTAVLTASSAVLG